MPSLLELNRDILEAIRNLAAQGCCFDGPVHPDSPFETDITPNIGEPPATWGGEEIQTWEEWELLVCAAASSWVDILVKNALLAQTLMAAGALTLALVAAILTLGGFAVVAAGAAASAWGALMNLVGTFVMADAAERLEQYREHLICAVKEEHPIYGGDLRELMRKVVPAASWPYYSLHNYDNIKAAIWEGYNPATGEFMDATPAASCPDCEELFDEEFLHGVWHDLHGANPNIVADCAELAEYWSRTAASHFHLGHRCSNNENQTWLNNEHSAVGVQGGASFSLYQDVTIEQADANMKLILTIIGISGAAEVSIQAQRLEGGFTQIVASGLLPGEREAQFQLGPPGTYRIAFRSIGTFSNSAALRKALLSYQ